MESPSKYLNPPKKKWGPEKLALIVLLAIGAFLRFYNLDWSKAVAWHPDERNTAVAVEQLKLPSNVQDLPSCLYQTLNVHTSSAGRRGGDDCQTPGPLRQVAEEATTVSCSCNFNPRFFAYGGLPIYLSFFESVIYRSVLSLRPLKNVSFPDATISLRFNSALLSTLTILLIYLIAKIFLKEIDSLVVAALVAFTPGLIQSAHFGTTESAVGFLLLLSTFLSLKYHSHRRFKYLFLISLAGGLSLGTKVSTITYAMVPLITFFIPLVSGEGEAVIHRVLKFLGRSFFYITLTVLIFFLSSPFNFLDFKSFKGSIDYEGSVAGGLPVFYTRQFLETLPIIFQYEKILPYALGNHLAVLGTLGVIFFLIYSIIRRRALIFIVIIFFLSFYLPNLLLFAKWTRFISPTFPFFPFFAVLFLRLIRPVPVRMFTYLPLLIVSILLGVSYWKIYTGEDVRYAASRWIYQNIPSNSVVLSETANVGDIPIQADNRQPENYRLHPVSFNFYDLDDDEKIQGLLINDLAEADYIFVPSRRIFKNHMRLKERYPVLNRYYENLFNGRLGFEEVAQFESFPKFSILNSQFSIDDEDAEETFTVFDHPVVRIYQKVKKLNEQDYRNLLGIKAANPDYP